MGILKKKLQLIISLELHHFIIPSEKKILDNPNAHTIQLHYAR